MKNSIGSSQVRVLVQSIHTDYAILMFLSLDSKLRLFELSITVVIINKTSRVTIILAWATIAKNLRRPASIGHQALGPQYPHTNSPD